MGKYLKPRYKLYRRENLDLFLKNRFMVCDSNKNENNDEDKKNIEYLPTHFFFQLKEKQKIKSIYGVMEKQFKKYYYKSKKMSGRLSENLIKLLESRLDNVVYRMGVGFTRSDSRQLINHRCVLVNNVLLDIPSYLVKIGDIISIKNCCKKKKTIISSFKNFCNNQFFNPWIFINFKNFSCYLKRYPELYELDIIVDENLVFDFYSR